MTDPNVGEIAKVTIIIDTPSLTATYTMELRDIDLGIHVGHAPRELDDLSDLDNPTRELTDVNAVFKFSNLLRNENGIKFSQDTEHKKTQTTNRVALA